jgi:TPR repeat protein
LGSHRSWFSLAWSHRVDANNNKARIFGLPASRIAWGAWLMLAMQAGTALAGPMEDAVAAFERGDSATAMRLFGPLAGNASVQTFLGGMYFGGMGVPQDYAEAARWFRKAADQGDAHGQFLLCSLYFLGKGVPQDQTEALKLCRDAAAQGDAEAQTFLGNIYLDGSGVPPDYAEAAGWFRKAAERGDAEAQTFLGGTYFGGIGVAQDDAEAAKWFRKAADQGYAEAQAFLGGMYSEGHGVPRDYIQAHKWLSLAASRFSAFEIRNRDQAIQDRDRVAVKMTSAQIAEARKMARDWKPKPDR